MLTVDEAINQMEVTFKLVPETVQEGVKKGKSTTEALVDLQHHVDFMHLIAGAHTKPYFCFPLGAPKNAEQRCSGCGDVPGDWDGQHKDDSECAVEGPCNICSAYGIGHDHNMEPTNRMHLTETCPFRTSNVPTFIQLVTKRLAHEHRGMAKGAVPQKTQKPMSLADSKKLLDMF
jgi:hypothetical protein